MTPAALPTRCSGLRPCLLPLPASLALVLAACGASPPDTSPGVSWELARHRVRTISDVRYGITLRVPAALGQRITGTESIRFALRDENQPLVLDFTAPDGSVLAVSAFGEAVPYEVTNGHIVVPASVLTKGENLIEIEFLAGDAALNRNQDFLYTLFVPDRASSAIPCFDQPNLKATYQLTLEIPASWEAVANAPLARSETAAERKHLAFQETRPLSTYLLAFAAGEFQVETAERTGRTLRLYHRETDVEKLKRNREAIFDLHATALEWLEDYTDIPYPFEKFDFVAIPSFQYGGMEHPGAILYRASSLFLDESPTQNQLLGRASLISHETAHMWFGDLVTMEWFNDVWMKEVFANFMAAKIVNPSFPEVDHDLRFFLAHHPRAYAVDRTAGANPIRQDLANLKEAGTLYGAIIYQKAPIVMQHLERLIGDDTMRDGLQEYLQSSAFGNATWSDLIAILDDLSDEDLRAWSRTWIDKPGRPTISADLALGGDGRIARMQLSQIDPWDRELAWNQHLAVVLGYRDGSRSFPAHLSDPKIDIPQAVGLPAPDFVLAGADGLGYGLFPLDPKSRSHLLQHLEDVEDPLVRSVAWMALWESLLHGTVRPGELVNTALRALPLESDEQNVQQILGSLRTAYWRFLAAEERDSLAPTIEALLWAELERAERSSLKAAYFDTYVSLAITSQAVTRLMRIWRKEQEIAGLPLSEQRYTALAEALAIREVANSQAILVEQLGRINNPDRRARFAFVIPALSADQSVRDSVFESFKEATNREHEPWVLSAVSYLHHPLRAAQSEKYIGPSLGLLEEIQRTGDIFFPLRWLNATLGGHRSPRAAAIVREFLNQRPNYPPRLRGKILQATDQLFRAAEIVARQ
ncbi:MAG: hypothetical protein GTN62_14950 [Gemmatimonadales bacterium]|nr:hypothetical protein [Gemmatimonadales bacterium]NIN13384.1 hypothetical protein [Gemmatimonadales bacterium]NIN51387.1 hypothetical protein [Gemmatimonadales bacterium]NIP08851.1 hypothetical protein [Gemmatimonadales bacterium]NIQ99845.1 hypothetical protein [Gemmatimonadales bacterium]